MKYICLTLSEMRQSKGITVYVLEQEDNKELVDLPHISLLVQVEMETLGKLSIMYTINIAKEIQDFYSV